MIHVSVHTGLTEPCKILSTNSSLVFIKVRLSFVKVASTSVSYLYRLLHCFNCSSGEQKKREEFYRERGEVDPSKLAHVYCKARLYGYEKIM